MSDMIDRDPPRGPEQPLTLAEYLQELDVSGWPGRLKLILVAVAVLVLLMGLNWARTFYTDWLWFSSLGYQQILLKIVTTKVWLFFGGRTRVCSHCRDQPSLRIPFYSGTGAAGAKHDRPTPLWNSETTPDLAFCRDRSAA